PTTTTVTGTAPNIPSNFTDIFGEMLKPLIIGMMILGVVASVSLVATILLIWKYIIKKESV
ncbi:MAG: hypothetical protein JW779_12175, partial [Candidatus Thorarchaeota archaeon]|nr:hypothetical protein [Candidatus Thorarchaeota archaeon]